MNCTGQNEPESKKQLITPEMKNEKLNRKGIIKPLYIGFYVRKNRHQTQYNTLIFNAKDGYNNMLLTAIYLFASGITE
jgi:hypothetical protein